MDFDLLNKACKINGVNKLVFNKMDILREVGVWKLFNDGELIEFKEENEMKDWIRSNFSRERVEIFFSEDKNKI